jgi:hypothetical protein
MSELDAVQAMRKDGSLAPEESVDAFDAQNAPGLSQMMLMRIYDVLMTQLRYDHGETISDNLLALHAQGAMLGPSPAFTQFIYDETNSAELGESSQRVSPEILADPITPDEEPLPHDSVSDKGLA